MLTRVAICEWMLYAMQWAVVICQCWLFIWTVKKKTLEISLWDVLLGNGYFADLRSAILGRQDWGFPHGAIYFVLLITLIGFFIIRNSYRIKQIQDKVHRKAMFVSIAVITIPLFYISIIAFALTVYPYIPYEKGGGDYTKESPVYITFNTNAITRSGISIVLPQNLLNENVSNQLILLDENDSFVYVAGTNNKDGGPASWRNGVGKPMVYEVSREAISCIVQKN
jgi:hypothetical protein